MSEAAFTPGPWHAITGDNTPAVIADPRNDGEGFIVADVMSPLPNDADARLIAAAPDLYAACEEAKKAIRQISSFFGRGSIANDAIKVLDAALAKARGQ